ncbi:BppU family phage baseplate upper protein [Schleiferilactobacillus perolens]|uniref:BppU family phage baseplate upper protein n=1 Tax=Schleiferilactobacillus perolens TaxID=100468 RepID=UPI002353FC70|nr:BppU family phage baseplate upper protein [Schleiferilactobacillus perolens]MCI2170693.1 BppU family phage baseplate upper protein [Schleiferilactobacillus perolens]
MQSPKLPMLRLDLAKSNSYADKPLAMTQGDKGYTQPFELSSGGKVLTDKDVDPVNVGLKMLKPDHQYIDIKGAATYADGQFAYPYPDEAAQAPGLLTGFFYVTDGDKLIASTQKFILTVAPVFADDTKSNSYVQTWDAIFKQLTEALTAALASRDTLDQLANSGQGIIDAKIAELTKTVNDWTSKTLADLTTALAAKQAALDQLNKDSTATYNQIKTFYETQKAEWTAAKSNYDNEAQTQRDGFATSFTEQLKTALDKVTADAQAQRTALESQFNNTFLKGLQADFDALKAQWTTSLSDLQKALDKATADQTGLDTRITTAQTTLDGILDKVQSIDPDLINAGIKTAKDAADAAQKTADTANAGVGAINSKLGTVPDGSTVMAEIAKGGKVQSVNGTAPDAKGNVSITLPSVAGMVKSATINGGAIVKADDTGNLALTVPNPDLSGFVTKADLDGRKYYTADQVTAAINTALTEFKSTLIWSGTQAEYDALTAEQKAQYIALGVVK